MKRLSLSLIATIIAAFSFAQTTAPAKASAIETVSVSSKGKDVREVLGDLFEQSKKSFVVEPNVHFVLFLSLKDVEFEEALDLICSTAKLKYKKQNGIYFISNGSGPSHVVAGVSVSRLPETVLLKKVSVSCDRTDLRDLFKTIGKQTGVPLVVDSKVPALKVDLVFKDVTLKYALVNLCKAAGLAYKFGNDATIQIVPLPDPNHITIHS